MVEYLKPPEKPVALTQQLQDQLMGWRAKPCNAGLGEFLTKPDPEPGDLVCARMADTIHRTVSSTGSISRDELIAAGFTVAEIEEHFTEAKLRARVAGMAI